MPENIEIAEAPERHRYEIFLDGALAGKAEYNDRGPAGGRVFTHTEVDPAFSGQGLAGKLIGYALDDVRTRGLVAVPQCPFVAKFVQGHPEYLDLVDAEHRAQLGGG